MTDIYFQNLQDFYAEYGLDKIYPSVVKIFIQKNYEDLFATILISTKFVRSNLFTERLYCYGAVFQTRIIWL